MNVICFVLVKPEVSFSMIDLGALESAQTAKTRRILPKVVRKEFCRGRWFVLLCLVRSDDSKVSITRSHQDGISAGNEERLAIKKKNFNNSAQ